MSEQRKTLRIAFVCSGNICRSPIAAALARRKLQELEIPCVIISAGTLGIVGHPAAEFGIAAAAEIGLDLNSHFSQGVSPQLMAMADFIVVMAPKHETTLLRTDPGLAPKIVRMWDYAGEPLAQIDDPVGQDLQAFRRCRDLLDTCLDNWIASLTSEP